MPGRHRACYPEEARAEIITCAKAYGYSSVMVRAMSDTMPGGVITASRAAAPLAVELSDFGTETAPPTDMLAAVGAIGGTAGGLGGRVSAADCAGGSGVEFTLHFPLAA